MCFCAFLTFLGDFSVFERFCVFLAFLGVFGLLGSWGWYHAGVGGGVCAHLAAGARNFGQWSLVPSYGWGLDYPKSLSLFWEKEKNNA